MLCTLRPWCMCSSRIRTDTRNSPPSRRPRSKGLSNKIKCATSSANNPTTCQQSVNVPREAPLQYRRLHKISKNSGSRVFLTANPKLLLAMRHIWRPQRPLLQRPSYAHARPTPVQHPFHARPMLLPTGRPTPFARPSQALLTPVPCSFPRAIPRAPPSRLLRSSHAPPSPVPCPWSSHAGCPRGDCVRAARNHNRIVSFGDRHFAFTNTPTLYMGLGYLLT